MNETTAVIFQRESHLSFIKIVLEKHIEKRLNQPKRHTGMPEKVQKTDYLTGIDVLNFEFLILIF